MSATSPRQLTVLPVLMSDKVRRVVARVSVVIQDKFKRGDRFWTVDQVARFCRVSRVTANLGIRELVKQGVLSSHRGQGIFVLQPPAASAVEQPLPSLEVVFGHGLGARPFTTLRVGVPDYPSARNFYTSVGRAIVHQIPFTQVQVEPFAPAPATAIDPDALPDVVIADIRTLRDLATSGSLMRLEAWIKYDQQVDLKAFFPETVRDVTQSDQQFALPFALSLDLLITRQPQPAPIAIKELLAIRPPPGAYTLNVPVPAHWLQACGVPLDAEGWFDLNHRAVPAALEAYAALYRSPTVLRTGLFTNEGLRPQEAFLKGRLLYYSTGSFRVHELRRLGARRLWPSRFDPALCPKVVRGTIGIAMKATTSEPKVAWAVLRALVSESAQVDYGAFGANLPARDTAARHHNFLGANGGDWSQVPALVKESVSTTDKYLANADYLRHVLAPGWRPYLEGEIALDECLERIQREQALARALSLAA